MHAFTFTKPIFKNFKSNKCKYHELKSIYKMAYDSFFNNKK